jgi:hypothetical protein
MPGRCKEINMQSEKEGHCWEYSVVWTHDIEPEAQGLLFFLGMLIEAAFACVIIVAGFIFKGVANAVSASIKYFNRLGFTVFSRYNAGGNK